MNNAKSFCRSILRLNQKAPLEELVALAIAKRDADERKFADHTLLRVMAKLLDPPPRKKQRPWAPTPTCVREALKVWTLGEYFNGEKLLVVSNSKIIRKPFRGRHVARAIMWLQR